VCLAVPGRIERIDLAGTLLPAGQVNFGGVRKQVNLAYVPEAAVGDYVLVHVGFAIAVIDPAEAARTLALLDEIEAVERTR
jgi:hydrogenase expression/formation protein HypC